MYIIKNIHGYIYVMIRKNLTLFTSALGLLLGLHVSAANIPFQTFHQAPSPMGPSMKGSAPSSPFHQMNQFHEKSMHSERRHDLEGKKEHRHFHHHRGFPIFFYAPFYDVYPVPAYKEPEPLDEESEPSHEEPPQEVVPKLILIPQEEDNLDSSNY